VASKETIRAMEIEGPCIYVGGCETIIRSYNLETAETKMYQGHKGWVYTIKLRGERMYSAGDDRSIIIWETETGRILEQLNGHANGVTCIEFANKDLYTGSFDTTIYQWDLKEMEERIEEKDDMRQADVESRRVEVYCRLTAAGKKKKGKGKKGKGGKKKK